jgi:GH35 family endo-1,4-beta-xylanase
MFAAPLFRRVFLVAAVLSAAAPLRARQTLDERLAPLPHRIVVQTEAIRTGWVNGRDLDRNKAVFFETTIDGVSTQAVRLTSVKTYPKHYNAQFSIKFPTAVKKGELYFVSFHMRTVKAQTESGEAQTFFRIQKSKPNWDRLAAKNAWAGNDWTQIFFSDQARTDINAGEVEMVFSLGFYAQTFEIAGLTVRKMAGPPSQLPSMEMGWEGIEPDAVWRRQAEKNIERYRKGELNVLVTNANGDPLPNATVRLTMLQSDFMWGAATHAKTLLDPANTQYHQTLKELFNTVTLGNDLKWGNWERDPDRALKALEWLRENGLRARGHCLIWPSWRKTRTVNRPQLQKASPAELNAALLAHIADEAGRVGDLVEHWDVVNEIYDNHDLIDIIGPGALPSWFKAAAAASPSARLYLNDYGHLSQQGRNETKHHAYYRALSELIESGAPIHGIGLQGHLSSPTPPKRILAILDKFAKLGKAITITEFDCTDFGGEELQARYLRDFLTAVFSHPAVNGIVTWGFWEGDMHAPSAAFYRRNWDEKPNAKIWKELVLDQWRTNAIGATDPQGRFRQRCFTGSYRVEAEIDGRTVSRDVALPKTGAAITLTSQ